MNKLFLLSIFSVILLMTSCKEDKEVFTPNDEPVTGTIEMNFKLMNQGDEIDLFEETMLSSEHRIYFKIFKAYLSNFEFTSTKDSLVMTEHIFLVDVENENTISFDIPENSYQAVTIGVGLNEEQNQVDPTTQNINDPLGDGNMHWGWAAFWRFILLEGQVDLETSGQFEPSFAYHLGLDPLYTLRSLDKDFEIRENETTTLTIVFDIDKFVNGDDWTFNPLEEGTDFVHNFTQSDGIPLQIMHNFAKAINIE